MIPVLVLLRKRASDVVRVSKEIDRAAMLA